MMNKLVAHLNKLIFLIGIVLFFASSAFATTNYVASDGTDSWADSEDIAKPCSLTTANANADDDDVVILRDGIYNTHIYPANSGSAGHVITYQAHTDEQPIIKNTTTTYTTYYHGICLVGRSYIKIDGIDVGPEATMNRVLMITHGGSYNEITNCVIDGAGSSTIQIWDGLTEGGTACTHNWIHGCTIKNTGYVTDGCNDAGGMQIGVPSYDNGSGYNTIEDCTFYSGGHHNLETFTKYNVIRNNYFHHEGSMDSPGGCTYGPDTNGKYGNRNIQIYDGYAEDKFNLVEGNRFGPSGPPPDDDGGDGMTITAPKNIIRYNEVYDAQNNGIYFKCGSSSISDDNRFYNNTIYHSGRYENDGPQWQGKNFRTAGGYAWASIASIEGVDGTVTVVLTAAEPRFKTGVAMYFENTINYNGYHTCTVVNDTTLTFSMAGTWAEETSGTARAGWPTVDNVIKNNIFYDYGSGGGDWALGAQIADYNTFSNNFCTGSSAYCSAYGDPKFVNADLSDPTSTTLPDLRLQSGSGAIDAGTYLTTVHAGDTSSGTSLIVTDALYFQDGTWGSSLSAIAADYICVGATVGAADCMQISAVNYATNTITVADFTRVDGEYVWLYKDSSGNIVLVGSAPDQGAYEGEGEGDTTPPVIGNIVPLPTVEYPSATTTVTVTWDTDECAVCRIGESDAADEDDLTNLATVETQGACGAGYGTSFSYDSTGLNPSDAKTYYIGGQDESAANETTSNAVSAFTINPSPITFGVTLEGLKVE